MQIDTDDLIPSSELTRNTALYVRQAAEGRRFVIINNSVPKAALVSMDDLKRLAALGDSSKVLTPDVSTYLDVLGIDDIDTYDPSAIWAEHQDNSRPALTAPIGLTDTGVYTIDLAAGGGLVLAGCTGSGKSTVLTMLLLSLCAQNSPQRLRVLVADYRRGVHWNGPSGLPHVEMLVRPANMNMGADLNRDEFERTVIDRITERLDDRRELSSLDNVPELLVVIDEWLRPRETLASLVDTLLAEGPELKVRLVITTQELSADDLDIVSGTDRIVLRQNRPQAARAALGEEPYPPLKRGEAAVTSRQRAGITRVRLFDPAHGLESASIDATPHDWMGLLGARIRRAFENEQASRGREMSGSADALSPEP